MTEVGSRSGMDELQALRMGVMWPMVVGAAAFLLARVLFWLVGHGLNRDHAVACMVVGCAGAIVAWAIALAWNDAMGYWLGFTLGLMALALILLVTCVQLVMEMWR